MDANTLIHSWETELTFADDDSSGAGPVISGIGSPFFDGTPETEFRILPDLVERVDASAFDAVLADSTRDVLASLNHDIDSQLLGRRSAGSLKLSKSENGLMFSVRPGNTTIAKDAIELISRKEIKGASIMFSMGEELWSTEGDTTVVTLRSIPLIEVGPVTRPAFEATTAQVERKRQLEEYRKRMHDKAEYMRRRMETEAATCRLRGREQWAMTA